jgi:mediator of RNA polymerase II transcription subunit 10
LKGTDPTGCHLLEDFDAAGATTSKPGPAAKNNTIDTTSTGLVSQRDQFGFTASVIAMAPERPAHLPVNPLAPVRDTSVVQSTIKDVIQHLYDVQIQTHGYVSETQDLLVDKMSELAQALSRLRNMTSVTASPNNPIHQVYISPEVVDYVDDSRNPDIYTREFVENIQRGNAVINGKQHAFRDFSEVYARALTKGIPGISTQVDQIMTNAGFDAVHDSMVDSTRLLDGAATGQDSGQK